jgi:hypothetical protein
MGYLLKLYAKYNVEYDLIHKILYIKSNIPVIDFVGIRKLLNYVNEEVKDIRVN